MQVETFTYDLETAGWSVAAFPPLDSPRTAVLVFGAPELVGSPAIFRALRNAYPSSHMVGCSTAGEIAGTRVHDRSLSVAVARFARTPVDSTAVSGARRVELVRRGPGPGSQAGQARAPRAARVLRGAQDQRQRAGPGDQLGGGRIGRGHRRAGG